MARGEVVRDHIMSLELGSGSEDHLLKLNLGRVIFLKSKDAKQKFLKTATLYDFITEEEIFQKYLYPVDYSKKFINPFRSRDKNAGCKFYKTQDRIYFVDFANPVKTHLSCMDIVQAYYNCDYFTAIYNINIDFNLNLFYKFEQGYTYQSIKKPKIVYQSTFKKEKQVNIVVSVKEFDQEGLTFWNNFGYTVKDLEKFKIKQFSRVIYNNTLISNNELAFGYYDKEGLFKVYHPHRTVDNYKFISIRRVLEGIDLIDYENGINLLEESISIMFTENENDFEKAIDDVQWWLYENVDKILTLKDNTKVDVNTPEAFIDWLNKWYKK
jgi:hypothetical protein